MLAGYQSVIRVVTGLFKIYSVDFPGPFKPSRMGKGIYLIEMELVTDWSIAWAKKSYTYDVFIKFVEKKIIEPIRPPRTIVSDNSMAFMVASVQ